MPDAPLAHLSGDFWRVRAPRWAFDPLSGEGAARNGGRYNPKGRSALYMSADLNTAVAEYQQDLRNRAGTFCVYRVEDAEVVDLQDEAALEALELSRSDLFSAWRRMILINNIEPPTWAISRALMEVGADGALVPSTQYSGGVNLVLWRWNGDSGCRVAALDPGGELPRNQRSWSNKETPN